RGAHADAASLLLFKQEFRTLADVQHTNLVHLYELEVSEGGVPFFTMELIRGRDFRESVERPDARRRPKIASVRPIAAETIRPPTLPDLPPRPPSPADIDRLRPALAQLCEGIQALHDAGRLHRDIKPSNILVTEEGRVVLLDFGVATELSARTEDLAAAPTGELVGTAPYMAPEMADETPPTAAADWYSVGAMLYEALVGRPPFAGTAVEVITMKNAVDAPPPSEFVDGVPPDLEALCCALLEREAAKRPTGAQVLARLGVRRPSSPPVSSLGTIDASSPIIGREGPMAALRRAFDIARAGRPVTMHLAGAPGVGKSALAHCFLDELARSRDAIVLRGRAYEREAVPYKAVDSVIDSLSRHLLRLAEAGEDLALPADMWALARLFPVIQRIPGVGTAAKSFAPAADDPHAVRRRAFGALRDVLIALSGRQPVVVFIDDAQWGDSDSSALLLEVLRTPGAPPLLLLMTRRPLEGSPEAASPFLVEMRAVRHGGDEMLDVTLDPLGPDEARRLALALMDRPQDDEDPAARAIADAVARESRGNPFLVEELVRGNRDLDVSGAVSLSAVTLERMVGERLERLPEEARRAVEVIAVAGHPISVPVVAIASGVEGSIEETLVLLGTRRFTRGGRREGRDVVEMANARIGEAIVEQLPPAAVRERHRRLALALDRVGGTRAGVESDAEAIAMHWLAAAENDRAGRYAETAAEQAAAKLAFDRAARLFQLALESRPDGDDARPLRARLAEVLRAVGRHEESARAYLAAAQGAPPEQAIDFRRAASEQLLGAGNFEEGERLLHGVLDAVGMKAPRTPLAAIFWLVVYRFFLALRGITFEERDASAVSTEDRLRVEALYTVTISFAVVDSILGACMQARHLIEALRVGHRFQVVRALALEASQLASSGRRQTERERALLEVGRALADRTPEPEARVFFDVVHGVGIFQRGHWRESARLIDAGIEGMPYTASGSLATGRIYSVHARYFLGRLRESSQRMQRICAEAEERGDLYTLVNLHTTGSMRALLAADEPDRARTRSREAVARWPKGKFYVQHWQAMAYEPDIDLYVGDGQRAYERFHRDMPALKKSFLLESGIIRAITFSAAARVAIGSIPAEPEKRAARIAEARAMMAKLAKEYDPWVATLTASVEAIIANEEGDRRAAERALRAAIQRAEATDTISFVPAAQIRLGQLLGGPEGQAMAERGRAALKDEGVVDPDRWANYQLPGAWSA
ncbi:MAG TPA: AAA family ATPase, partial [Polyangiaceae bacterium]|nr:AAA family ATPase [Polyangiaceae bacterium]